MSLDASITRRQFLLRASKAGLAAAAAGSGALLLHDRKGPSTSADGVAVERDWNFSTPADRAFLAIARGGDRARGIDAAIGQLGGISRFVRPGDRVVLKVNAAFASPAVVGATTHPDALRAVVRLCLGAGAASVAVTDNSINDPRSCFRLSGLDAAAQESGARIILPEPKLFAPISLPGGRLIRDWPVMSGVLDRCDKLISLAPVKDHHRSGASLSMKNWYGLLGGRRNVFHQDIHSIIVELARLFRPTLVILDGTQSMMTNGPTGGSLADLNPTRTIVASTDQVAADACACELLGRSTANLPFIARAAAAGCGRADYRALRWAEVNLDS